MPLRISVIIVNYNVKDLLSASIASLYRNLPVEEIEVIVVDNASTDGSEEFIKNKYSNVIWIGNKSNAGFSAANNQGMRIAKANVMMLLNPDTELLDDVLPELLKQQNSFPQNIIIPKLLNSDGSLQISCWKFPQVWGVILEALYLHLIIDPYNYSKKKFDTIFSPDCASGAALLFGKNIYHATGGLDEDMFWSEDIDFCYSAKEKGMPLIYFPEYKIYHHSGKSSSANLNVPISNQLLSKAKYLRKHFGWLNWFVSLWFILFQIVTRIIVFGILSIFKANPYGIKRRAYIFTLRRFFEYVFLNSKSLT